MKGITLAVLNLYTCRYACTLTRRWWFHSLNSCVSTWKLQRRAQHLPFQVFTEAVLHFSTVQYPPKNSKQELKSVKKQCMPSSMHAASVHVIVRGNCAQYDIYLQGHCPWIPRLVLIDCERILFLFRSNFITLYSWFEMSGGNTDGNRGGTTGQRLVFARPFPDSSRGAGGGEKERLGEWPGSGLGGCFDDFSFN